MNLITRRICLGMVVGLGSVAAALPVAGQEVHRVAPEKLSGSWILLNTKVDVDVPNTGQNLDKPGCVAVTYIIGTDGVPRDVKAARVVPKSDLAATAVSAVTRFRYGPSLSNRNSEPVDTYYIVPFNTPDDPAQKQQLINACRLPGYDLS